MIKTQYALCAERILLDLSRNLVSAIDILDNRNISSFPVAFRKLDCVWALTRDTGDPEQPDAKVTVFLNDENIFETPLRVNFQGSTDTRALLTINGLVIQKPGRLRIQWAISGEEKAQYYADFKEVPNAEQPPQDEVSTGEGKPKPNTH